VLTSGGVSRSVLKYAERGGFEPPTPGLPT
jgi:hypothetical protein